MDARYLRVRNWDKFQHYHNRPNPPHWIKMYPALLEDYAFRQLPELEQGRLLKVWLLAGKLRNRLPFDARYVAQVTGSKKVNLELYVLLGWLEVTDEDGNLIDIEEVLDEGRPVSTPVSRPASMPEEEKREEKDGERESASATQAVTEARPPANVTPLERPDSRFQIPDKARGAAA